MLHTPLAYYVDDIIVFHRRNEHAVIGDTIVFRSDMEIDLYDHPFVYLNANGNGQYLHGNGNCKLHDMSLTVTGWHHRVNIIRIRY